MLSTRVLSSVCCLLAATCPSFAAAQQDLGPGGARVYTGVVQDDAGEAVAGAEVTVVGGEWNNPVDVASTVSAQDGSFRFEVSSSTRLSGVWATAGGRIGWAGPVRPTVPITIQLTPGQKFVGQCVDENNQPIVGARLVPMGVRAAMDGGSYIHTSATARRRWTVTTDASGRFTLEGLSPSGVLSCDLVAPAFGSPRVSFVLHKPLQLRLGRSQAVTGTLKWPADAVRPQNAKTLGKCAFHQFLMFDGDKPATSRATASHSCLYRKDVAILADGTVEIDALPPGKYNVRTSFEPEIPLSSLPQSPLVVEQGQPAVLRLTAARAYRVQGRVISSADSTPVANASVQLTAIQEGRMRYVGQSTTGENGLYIAHVAPGRVRVRVASADGFVGTPDHGSGGDLWKERFPDREVTGDTLWPDLKLDPATDLVVQVVDQNDQPVPNALVKVTAAAGPASKFFGARTTDSAGKCTIKAVDVTDTLPIWARTRDAVSDSRTVVTPGEVTGPVRITIGPDQGVRFRCKVVDRDGTPIPNATVSFRTSFAYVSKWVDSGLSLSGSAGLATTDENGVVVSGPLWTGQTYWIKASADGYDVAEAPQLVGTTGIVDIQTFVLKPSRASIVTGTVVDLSGEVVAGARVFAAGKNWWMPEVLSADDGSFRLEDVSPDIRYVFADAPGYRFGGARIRSSDPVAIRLRLATAAPVGIRPSRPLSLDERAAAVTPLMDRSLKITPKASYSVLRAMTLLDADQALFLSDAAGGRYSYVVRGLAAEQIAARKPDKAVELLRPSRTGFTNAIAIGLRLLSSQDPQDRRAARQLAELARELVKKRQVPSREYPRLIPLLTALGDSDEARRLALRSADLAAKAVDPEDSDAGFIYAAAVAVAPYDYARTRELCDRLSYGYTRCRAQADAAVAIAAQDPDKALAELNALKGDSNTPNIRDRARARVALMLVDQDPAKAVEVVRSCSEPDNRAQAIGWLCVPLAVRDKQAAWDLIDEALAIHRAREDAYRSWSNFGGAGPPAARLAQQALRAGYPDMESVIWHVRAACRARGEPGMERLRATVKTAKVLALVDRIAARELLNAVSHQEDQLGRTNVEWWQAWALTDFNRSLSMHAEQLDEDAERGKLSSVYQFDLLLHTDPEKQFQIINKSRLALWELEE